MDKLKIRTIFEVLHRVQIEGLARMASDGRICSEQKSSYGNKGFVFHGKL